MSEMKSMKIKREKSKGEKLFPEVAMFPDGQPLYPWGTQITLNEERLKLLGIKDLPKVDQKMKLEAIVDVTGVSSDASTKGEQRRVQLQITDMALGSNGKEG